MNLFDYDPENDRHTVGFAFLDDIDYEKVYELTPWEIFLNRLGNAVHATRIKHVEIQNMETRACYTVLQDSKGVTRKYRKFSDEHYRLYTRRFTPEQHKLIFEFLDFHVENKTPFNYRGFYLNFSPLVKWGLYGGYDANTTAFFCSELIAHALIYAGVYTQDDLVPQLTDPDMLYEALNYPEKLVISDSLSDCTAIVRERNAAAGGGASRGTDKRTSRKKATPQATEPVARSAAKKRSKRMSSSSAKSVGGSSSRLAYAINNASFLANDDDDDDDDGNDSDRRSLLRKSSSVGSGRSVSFVGASILGEDDADAAATDDEPIQRKRSSRSGNAPSRSLMRAQEML
jgi:hypothetical protein